MTSRWFSVICILIMGLFGIWCLTRITTPVPLHSNENAVVDVWATPLQAILIPPLFAIGLYMAMLLGRRGHHETAHTQYVDQMAWLALNMTLAVLCVLYIAILGRSLGWVTEVRRAVVFAFGMATFIAGYYLPRAQAHEWVGIRTPWTLKHPQIWDKTHQAARWTFIMGGIMICSAAWLQKPYRRNLAMIGFVCAVLVPVVYSYLLWRRDFRQKNADAAEQFSSST